ncbi:MAG: hypothetical protein E5X94_00470 [Mesorhizobium sp.]|uniref:hypothetical protein n=1 Tax=unclassified Mesorhizobium TaxID=325217 RepID=UPI000FCB563F|nr:MULTISPECIES: hypothetical protein [unclassified Mesorhizobium]RUW04072.1 hypothetical protein EOA49_00660 [Mesorhizobium sp. M1A.F.Ca.IN.020.04.1.1]RUW04135.1 hypothetical protein EOA49_00995 [Mesorhizobium sp. M1A.F.Ca.IN.020.04.1.1]TIN82729.1 MAG: hypothetical protein E5X97_28905 [Mesorhizobium sp.]TIN88313.1 MAG: hypothetical protein E5X94_00470 [Mesorhizobium sp.]
MAESEIPEDIRVAAKNALQRARLLSILDQQIDIIAQALMAERERCAQIAEKFAKESWGLTELVYAGESLASAIRQDRGE